MTGITPLQVARALKLRAPWDVGSKILHLHGVKRARGWQNTIDGLASGEIKLREDDAEVMVNSLQEHIECGEKLTRFYRLKGPDLKKLASRLRNSVATDDPLAVIYPLSLETAELDKAPLEWGRLIHARESESEDVFVFSGVRAVEMRVKVDPASLPEEVRSSVAEYTELIGVQERRIQTMDVIRVPKSEEELVEVRCDFPQGLTAEGVATSIQTLHKQIAHTIGDDAKPLNLFPIIEPIFKAKDEGDVVEAAFTTRTGSVKHERMRRHSTSLREEPYHKAGREAIADALDVYKLAVRWTFDHSPDVTSDPEVFFSGTTRMVGTKQPWLSDVSITGCVGEPDYNFVRDKIISYLQA